MTGGGTESPFEKEFAAMQESRAVDAAAALAATVHEAAHATILGPPPPGEETVAETAEQRALYNCMAWALGLTDVWIQPLYTGDNEQAGGWVEVRNRNEKGIGDNTFLPGGEAGAANSPRVTMVQVAEAYGAKKTVKVDGKKMEASATSATPTGYYKLVVFEGKNMNDTHVMRQEANSTWSSKNGAEERVIGIANAQSYYDKRYAGHSAVQATYMYRKISKRKE